MAASEMATAADVSTPVVSVKPVVLEAPGRVKTCR